MPFTGLRARAWACVLLFACAPLAVAQTIEIYAGGRFFRDDPATSVQVMPHSIARAPDGFFYLADWNGPLLRFEPGPDTISALPGIQGRPNFLFGGIEGLAAHPNGQVHGANEFALYWINVSGGVLSQIGSMQSGGPMVYGADGTLYYASWQDHRVRARLPSGTIVILAGNGTAGFSGDGGAATLAQLNGPNGLALDLSGNVYIIDNGNHRIRRIDRTTGVITTVAGSGVFGFNGAGLPALQTNFGYPTAITFDAGGNLIISAESRIHSVSATTGLVTHLAGTGYSSTSTGDGGPATSASFTYIGKMTYDNAGRLYAIDSNRVRRIDLASGIITTAIGNGDPAFCGEDVPARRACLTTVFGLDVSQQQDLLFTSDAISRVRGVSPQSGLVSTLSMLPNNDSGRGIEHDAAGNLYVTSASHRVYRIDATTRAVTTFAGTGQAGSSGDGGLATAARLSSPKDIAIDADGNAFILEAGNQRIRRVDAATGVITTYAGQSCCGPIGDGLPALYASIPDPGVLEIDPQGNLVLSDGCRIRRIDRATTIITTIAGNGLCTANTEGDGGPATAARLGTRSILALDPTGNIFIAYFNKLRRVDVSTGLISTIGGSNAILRTPEGYNFVTPNAMEFDNWGNLYIGDYGQGQEEMIFKISGLPYPSPDTTPPVIQPQTNGVPGGNDWYRSDVHVWWTVTDSESAVSSTSGCESSSVTSDTTGVTFTCTATSTGGTATRSITIKRDTMPPTLAFGDIQGEANSAGWYGSDVSIPFQAADDLSGVYWTSHGSPLVFSSDGAGQNARVEVQDVAGNTAFFTSPTVNIDRTAPFITYSVTGTEGGFGWYRSDIQITWTIDDAQSLSSSEGCEVTTVTEDTGGTSYTCTATSPGGTTSRSVSLKRDTTPPMLVFGLPYPQANEQGWHQDNVWIGFETSDGLSGVASASEDNPVAFFEVEGAGLTKEVMVTDRAGNSATFTTPVINIDRSRPVVEFNVSGPVGDNGWYRGNVSVTWTVSDGNSGVISQEGCGPSSVTADTTGITFTCTAVSNGGTTSESVTVKRDATPPTLEFGALSPAPDSAGWNGSAVSIPFTAADATSGIRSPGPASPLVFDVDGADMFQQVVVADNAGNVATFESPRVNIDRTAPVVQPVVTGTLGNNGWYTSAVEVHWSISDVPSSVIGCDSEVIEADTAGVTLTCTATSSGGTTSNAVTIRRDTTPPVLTFGTPSPLPNANGWNKVNVSIPFTRSDAVSGIASTSVASPLVLSTEGAGVTGQVVVTDNAGNSATFTSVERNIDKSVPVVAFASPAEGATYAFYQDVVADYSCTDTSLLSCTAPTPSGGLINTRTAGARTFRVTAKDAVNFTTAETHNFTVESSFNFDGFLAPASPPPTLNLVTRGSLVPIRWRLPDGRGGFVTNPASFTSATVGSLTCGSAPSVPLNDTATGPAGISYDATTSSFVYNWQTGSSWTGCRKLTIKLKDNSVHELRFRFQ